MKPRNAKGRRPLSQPDSARPQASGGKAERKAGDAGSNAKMQPADAAAKLASDHGLSEFDAAKVASIAQAIADGTYVINAEAIADTLIGELQELLGNPERPR